MKRMVKTLELELAQRELKIVWDDERQILLWQFNDRDEPTLRFKLGDNAHATAEKIKEEGFRLPYLTMVQRDIERILDSYQMSEETHEDVLVIDEVMTSNNPVIKDFFILIDSTICRPLNVH